MDIFKILEQQNIFLTDCQKKAVTSREKAVLLLAVPGAGKTTTLAARAAWLMAEGLCAPDRMLNLTFNREAAADMQRRFDRLFGHVWPTDQQPRFSTIHSFCYRLLGDYAADRGTEVPKLLAEGQQRSMVLNIYREKTGEYLTEEGLDQLINAIGLCANLMYDQQECRRLEREVHGLGDVRQAYKTYKLEHHLMDFDDMLSYALQVLRRQPDRAARLRLQYPYLHLDEAQDTSLLQHSIIEALDPANVFFVGDEDQSIYGFRGAFPDALLEFEKRHRGGVVLKMEDNFRSADSIVEGANAFVAGNRHRYPKNMHPFRSKVGGIHTLVVKEADRQYAKVAEELKNLPQNQTAAVLYRGGLTAAAMADVLLRQNIPFALRAKRYPLLQDGVVRDVLSMLRLALDPSDGQAFLQVYYKLGCYINREMAQRVVGAKPHDLWEYLAEEVDFPGKSTARISFLQSFFRRMRGWTAQRAIDRVVYELEYIDRVEKRGESGYAGELAAQRLAVLHSIAGGCGGIAEFADRLAELDEQIDRSADPQAAVTLSTVHSAKGREFDRVWIIDLIEGVFPSGQAVEENLTGNDMSMEEEARMFYVAATRAKDSLTLCTVEEFCGYELLSSRFVPRILQSGQAGESQEILELGLRRGVRLSHKTFGFGTVEDIDITRGIFAVRFAKLGVKTFSVASMQQGDIFRIL
ncbi:MAG: ATP-dependent helicase [Oscillospiraceae bacterium]|nr:ATP-dependent helicase [Oscillospiraceae bacterium]